MIFPIGWILFGFLGGRIVAKKDYEPKYGIALGFLGLIGLVVALLLPTTQAGLELKALEYELANAPKRANCPNCGKQIEFGLSVCLHCQYVIAAKNRS